MPLYRAATGGGTDDQTAAEVPFTPTGTVAATDVQAAIAEVAAEGGGAPTTADYLVGTTQGGLSNEIVVGATPGGEFGGTWGSPTVDASHSGSTHAAAQAAAEATAAGALSAHTADATDAHDASAISVLDVGTNFTGTEVEAVLAELFAAISAGGIPGTIVDAKGDTIAATAADTVVRVPVGANGTVYTADSTEAAGVKWAAPGGSGLTPSNCKAYNTTTQSVSTGSALTFNAEEYDTDTYHDNSTNPTRFTVPATGAYEFMGGSFFASATGGGPLIFLKNGTTEIRGSAESLPNEAVYGQASGAAALTAGDYIEIIYQGTNTVTCGHASILSAQSWFAIKRIG